MNGFALGLSLKSRLRATWKWAFKIVQTNNMMYNKFTYIYKKSTYFHKGNMLLEKITGVWEHNKVKEHNVTSCCFALAKMLKIVIF